MAITAADFETINKGSGAITAADFVTADDFAEDTGPSFLQNIGSKLNTPTIANPQTDVSLIGDVMKGIGGGVSDAFSRFKERSTPLTYEETQRKGDPNDLEGAEGFPMTQAAREGDIPLVSSLIPQTKGVVPGAARIGTSAIGFGLDSMFNLFRTAPGQSQKLSTVRRLRMR